MEIKKRTKKQKSDLQKQLDNARKKSRSLLPIHTLEVELRVNQEQKKLLIDTSEQMRQLSNVLIGTFKKNYKQMIRTKRYKKTMNKYFEITEKISKINNKIDNTDDKKLLKELKNFKKQLEDDKKLISNQLEDIRINFNIFNSYYTKKAEFLYKNVFTNLNSVLALKVTNRCWLQFEKLMFKSKTKKIKFKKYGFLPSLEGKQAERCIVLKQKQDKLYINALGESFELKIKNNDIYTKNLLELIKVYMNDSENIENININRVINGQKPLDTYRIIFNRIVIKRIRGKFRFYVQILYEGRPWKLDKNGNLKNKQGTGRIGIDYGTSTIAVVSESKVIYKNLAEEANNLKHLERQLKILQRKMDRSRRSTNPDCFNSDGTYKKGTKIKVKSRNYKKILKQFREINRKLSCIKKYEIGRDANIIRSLGDQIYGEHMNFQGLAKRSKNTTINQNTGKINKKKRFGKSIFNRCPGLMVSTLKNKFGNGYHEVNTWEFKASQYNHITNTCIKKKLSQRIQELDYNGETITIQRDLYSAFLLMNSNNTLDKPDLNLCNITFENFIVNHTICINNLKVNNIKVNNSKY